jgi:tetratricopeptide (TPR) repeat protein
VNPHLLVILVGLFYVLAVGGMSLLRREGLSLQFALEALAIIALAVLIGSATGTSADPILLFLLLYLVTTRARLLTDLANLLFKRRGYAAAEPLYRLALRLFPDRPGRFIVLVNWGIARLQHGDLEGAIGTLSGVLASADEEGGLGAKYEAACRYNLAVAHRKAGNDVEAVRLFNQVAESFPATIYGQASERALKERRERGLPRKEAQDDERA